jgi:hypothetical protein
VLDWHVAAYAVNEAERLEACLRSAVAALEGTKFQISLILNGSTDGSEQIARQMTRSGSPISIYRIDYPDKSNAINQFYYHIRQPARYYAEIDSNVIIAPYALRTMAARLDRDPLALTVSGIATNGRTMPKWDAERARGGRLMGNLHALRPEFVDRIVAHGFRLPVGLYRGDGLIGSMAAHNLDPQHSPWDNARVAGEREAHVLIHQLSPWRISHLKRQFRRKISQMRGTIENAALQNIIYCDGFAGLPENADDMITQYLAKHPLPPVGAADRIFQRMAVQRSATAARPAPGTLQARLLGG